LLKKNVTDLLSQEGAINNLSKKLLFALLNKSNRPDIEKFYVVQSWCDFHAKERVNYEELRTIIKFNQLNTYQLSHIVWPSGMVEGTDILSLLRDKSSLDFQVPLQKGSARYISWRDCRVGISLGVEFGSGASCFQTVVSIYLHISQNQLSSPKDYDIGNVKIETLSHVQFAKCFANGVRCNAKGSGFERCFQIGPIALKFLHVRVSFPVDWRC